MDDSTSLWLCILLVVVSMSMTIGCLWCYFCAMAWIGDCASVNMTMLLTPGGLGLSQSLEMVCKAEHIALNSAPYLLQCCQHASLLSLRVVYGYCMAFRANPSV